MSSRGRFKTTPVESLPLGVTAEAPGGGSVDAAAPAGARSRTVVFGPAASAAAVWRIAVIAALAAGAETPSSVVAKNGFA